MNGSIMISRSDFRLSEFLAPAYQFVRSINVKLDMDEKERIAHYLPTHSAASLTTEILQSIHPKSNHRVRTIIGPYGVGKSAYALYLLALLSKKEENIDAVRIVSERFQRDFPDAGESIVQWLSSDERFLPVVLSGYEGDMCTALNRALKRSLTTFGFSHLVLPTAFSANQTTLQWMLLLEEHFRGFVHEEEKRSEPLNYLRLAMTRWLNITLKISAGGQIYGYS